MIAVTPGSGKITRSKRRQGLIRAKHQGDTDRHIERFNPILRWLDEELKERANDPPRR